MPISDSLILSFVARNEQFLRGTREASASLHGFRGVIETTRRHISGLFAGAAAFFSTRGLVAWVRGAAAAADATAKLADRLGVSTRMFAGLQLAGELAGVSSEELTASLTRATKALAEAQHEAGSARRTMMALGLDFLALREAKPDESILALADALAAVPDRARRLQLALEVFGRGSAAMLNLIAGGRRELLAAIQEAERRGLGMSREDLASIEAANDAWTRIRASVRGLGQNIALELAPSIEDLTAELDGWIDRLGGVRHLARDIADFIREPLKAPFEVRPGSPVDLLLGVDDPTRFNRPMGALEQLRFRERQARFGQITPGELERERVSTRRVLEAQLRRQGAEPTVIQSRRVQFELERITRHSDNRMDQLTDAVRQARIEQRHQLERLIRATEMGGLR
jgi:hypothetical protein